MKYISKRIIISGIAGVLLACFITATAIIVPQSELIATPPSTLSGTCPRAPIQVNMSISTFEPQKLGGEANLTVTVTHFEWDSPDTWIEIFSEPTSWMIPEEFRGGIIFVSGERKWHGYLNANVPVTFDLRIKANKVGNWTTEAHVMCMFGYHLWYEERKILGISVTEDNVGVVPGGFWTLPPQKVALEITVSKFTEPQGIGSEAEITVTMTSHEDIANVTTQLDWSRGFDFVSGDLTWSGNLKANVTVSFKARIKAIEIGRWGIHATAEGIVNTSLYIPELGEVDVIGSSISSIIGSKDLFIIVFTDKIVISETEQVVY